ncbi:MAG: type 4a pilus biogenesis protein PilO [Thermodesulfovibrionales bacterium]|nr:type 4a pilus biogenesis protein PilO [Thermodesulfovibrionales bacterium]
MAKKIDLNALPKPVKLLIMFGLPVVILILAFILLVNPKLKVINRLEADINKQRTEIADKRAKAERLDILIKENELLKKRLAELLEQLPEEKEVSGLLREVSQFGQNAGLEITLWKPAEKKTHPSNIVYEIPVTIEAVGSFNNFGSFLNRVAFMKRIVNVPDMKMTFQKQKEEAELKIAFRVVTFSAIPEEELQKTGAKK